MTKYYKLLKDLPTFNKGDLFRLSDKGSLFLVDPNPPHWKDTVMAYHHSTLEHFPNILKDWFEEVESPSASWAPEMGEIYFIVSSFGNEIIGDKWCNEYLDKAALAIGNAFRTKEEAEKALKWLQARKVLFDDTKGFKQDWGDGYNYKLTVAFDWSTSALFLKWSTSIKTTSGPFFATAEDAQFSIREHRKEWLTYLGVEDCDGR